MWVVQPYYKFPIAFYLLRLPCGCCLWVSAAEILVAGCLARSFSRISKVSTLLRLRLRRRYVNHRCYVQLKYFKLERDSTNTHLKPPLVFTQISVALSHLGTAAAHSSISTQLMLLLLLVKPSKQSHLKKRKKELNNHLLLAFTKMPKNSATPSYLTTVFHSDK